MYINCSLCQLAVDVRDDPHRPKLPRPTAPFGRRNSTDSPTFGNGKKPAWPQGRVGPRDALLGIDFGEKCHFSNFTRGLIKRWQAVSWCDSAAVAVLRAAAAALPPEGEAHRDEGGAAPRALGTAEPAASDRPRRSGAETAGSERQRPPCSVRARRGRHVC